MTRLNLGAGDRPLDGFVNLDRQTGWFVTDGLAGYPDGSVEAITVSHLLSYVPVEHRPGLFAELARVLAPGGVVRVTDDAVRRPVRNVIAVSATEVVKALHGLGLRADPVDADTSAFRDRSLLQSWHGDNVFYVEAVKPGGADYVEFTCPDCQRTFGTAQGLKIHMTKTHKPNGDPEA